MEDLYKSIIMYILIYIMYINVHKNNKMYIILNKYCIQYVLKKRNQLETILTQFLMFMYLHTES